MKKLIAELQTHNKTIVAALGFVLSFLYYYQTTNPSTWVSAAIGLLTVLGVRQIANQK